MNKFILVGFALFAVLNSVQCDSTDEVLQKVKPKDLRHYLTDHKEQLESVLAKFEKQCPGVSEKLKEAIKSFFECAENSDDSLTVCTAIQTYALNCTRPLVKVLDDCMYPQVKGLPILGLKSVLSATDYLCKQPGESLFEFANPCVYEDWESDEATGEIDPCERKLRNFGAQHGNDIPNKADICSFVTDLRSCIQNRTSTFCKNQKTRNVVLGAYDAFVVPCSHINKV